MGYVLYRVQVYMSVQCRDVGAEGKCAPFMQIECKLMVHVHVIQGLKDAVDDYMSELKSSHCLVVHLYNSMPRIGGWA